MSFLAPIYLALGAGAASAVFALHFIVMRQPPEEVLPTARFIPMRPAVARTVARRPEHLLLLVLRMLAILLVGAGFARPVWRERKIPVARIVVVDRSRAVRDAHEGADSAARLLVGAADVVVLFDSTARVIETHGGDSVRSMRTTSGRGALSPALIAAIREAATVAKRADSVELTVVSPALADEIDAATDSIRGQWPGAVRLMRVAARIDTTPPVKARVRWPGDGHVPGATARARVDTANGVVAGPGARGAVVVAPFERRWRIDTTGGRVVARWIDGEPAAVERVAAGASGTACERDVAIVIPTEGDLVLRPEWQRFVDVIRGACGSDDRLGAPGDWRLDAGRPRRVAATALTAVSVAPISPIAMWLLLAALAVLVAEPVARWIRTP